MQLKRPKFYTDCLLADYWNKSIDFVKDNIKADHLVLSLRFTHDHKDDYWVDLPPDGTYDPFAYVDEEGEFIAFHQGFKEDGKYIRLEEAERFEKEHGLDNIDRAQKKGREENQKQRTGKELRAHIASIKNKLEMVEKDKAVVIAMLMDDYHAKAWIIIDEFKIELHPTSKAKDALKGKEKIVYRLRDKGRKIIKTRSEIK